VTCTPLLLPDRVEAAILQPPHLELEEWKIHDRPSAVVVGLGLKRGLSRDPKDRHPPAVRPADVDPRELAASQERQTAQEEVVGSKHPSPPGPGREAFARTSLPKRRPPLPGTLAALDYV
jgi:hypothetical protein